MSEPKALFKAELVDKDGKKEIDITLGTTHYPYLCYALKLLEMHIENEMIKAQVNKTKIASPGDINLLQKMLKR